MVVVFVMLICFGYLLLQAYKTLPNNKYRKISIAALSLAVIAFLMAAPGIQYKVEKQVGSNTIVGRFIRGKKIDIGNIVKLNDQGSSRLLAYFEEQKADLVLHDFQFRSLNNISAIPHYAPKGVTLSPFYRQEKIDLTKRENLSFFEKNPEADIILHNWHDQVDKMDLLTNHTKAPEMNLFIISFKALCRQAEDSNKHVLLLLGNRWPNVRNILTTELHLRPAKETEEYVIYDFETLRNAGVCESGGKLYLGQEIKKLAQQNPNLPIAELFMPLLKAHAANADVFTSSQDNFPGVVFFH